MVDIPKIETKRLILRAHVIEDIEAIWRFKRSDRSRYAGGSESNFKMAEAWKTLTSTVGQWTMRGYGMWALESKETQKVIGVAGIVHPIDWPEPELGYSLYSADHEGKGYITEASRKILPYIAEHFGLDKVCSCIDAENTASIHVAEQLGARYEKLIALRGVPAHVYRHKSWVAD